MSFCLIPLPVLADSTLPKDILHHKFKVKGTKVSQRDKQQPRHQLKPINELIMNQ